MKMKEWLLKNAKFIQALVALITLVLFIWGAVKIFFSTSDLEVVYQYSDAELPSSIGGKYSKSLGPMVEYFKKEKNTEQLNNVFEVNDFLNKTRNKVKYEITNNSKYTIKNLDIRIKNVTNLTAWGVSGNILQSVESNAIMRKMRSDNSTGVITFSGIEKLPPQTTLIINIWGDIREYNLDDPIIATYDGGSSEIIRTSLVKGFDSFIYENSSFLVVMLLLLNIGGFLFIVDSFYKKIKMKNE